MFDDPISKSLEWSRKGYMGMALLLMINERPLSGYEIMRTMRETTQGYWKPTPGGVYPVLKKLELEGLVRGEWLAYKGRKRKVYNITEDGRRILEHVLLRQSEIAMSINRVFESFLKDMFSLNNPQVAPPCLFTTFISELDSIEEEVETLKAKREMILRLIEMLQRCLETIESKLEETKTKSTF
ncbi:MAG: helix-turn-helix transcriptional regulator [Candidatus Verstraetearchaeota archaeon]|nr:helix-turn-helix transcriptional regulator [Candidatus Verstraetearchaeota archaeon]